mmetsp:Transcript_20407/g.65158  ORF Transcript_20407/g.65158 Transcript_20407/m.65158 type:complete len:266 (-) Transcript_20407:116-913(-)
MLWAVVVVVVDRRRRRASPSDPDDNSTNIIDTGVGSHAVLVQVLPMGQPPPKRPRTDALACTGAAARRRRREDDAPMAQSTPSQQKQQQQQQPHRCELVQLASGRGEEVVAGCATMIECAICGERHECSLETCEHLFFNGDCTRVCSLTGLCYDQRTCDAYVDAAHGITNTRPHLRPRAEEGPTGQKSRHQPPIHRRPAALHWPGRNAERRARGGLCRAGVAPLGRACRVRRASATTSTGKTKGVSWWPSSSVCPTASIALMAPS